MVGKARSFSDEAKEAVYEKQFANETYSAGAQQNSYNLGSVHFSDQSGIANITQAGTDQRKASVQGALFRGNVGFDLQTALLDIGTSSIDLNIDGASAVLPLIATDRIVTLSSGTTADLTTITGPQRPGQRLFLYSILGNTITIKNTASATPNTILTPGQADVELTDNGIVELIFDITTTKWRVLAGAGGGGNGAGTGTYASADMDQDQVANMTLNDHFQFNQYVENGGISLQGLTPTFDQTSGIFELKAGKTYSLEADVSAEFNSNADSAQMVWYDRTNATELGRRGKSNPLSSAGQLTNKHSVNTIFTPVTDIEVEVRIIALTGTITTAFSDSSQANIFEFSGSGDGGSSTGTYIASKMDQDQLANLAVNNHIQFNDIINNGGIVLQGLTPTFDQTSGIYELKAGQTYYLSAYLAMQFVSNADGATLAWWDITNGVQVSQVMSPQPANAANTGTMNLTVETIFTPVTDVTVELRIISVTGTIGAVLNLASQANIFEFSTSSGEDPIILNEFNHGNQGPVALNIDWSVANFQRMVLTGNVAINHINLPTTGKWEQVIVEYIQDNVGGHNVTYSQGFANGVVPLVNLAPGSRTTVIFYAYFDAVSFILAFETRSAGNTNFLHATKVANQAPPLTVGTNATFDSILSNSGLTVVAGVVSGFRAGRIYECECSMAILNNVNPGACVSFQWNDIALATLIGSRGDAILSGALGIDSAQPIAKAVFAPISDTDTLEVQFTFNNDLVNTFMYGTGVAGTPQSYIMIKDIT